MKNKVFHFIGIGGISMSALAQMLSQRGFSVQGSDIVENDEVLKLKNKNIKVFIGHSKKNIQNADVIVYSSAIHDDNEELMLARRCGLIILKRAELLGIIANEYKCVISVAGSHGKTTVTAMISEMLEKAKLKPTVNIGGKDIYFDSNYKIGNKKYFVVEACEYMDNYQYIKSDIAVILNIDSDHLDYFGNSENIKKSFLRFSKNTKGGGIVIKNGDDNNSDLICGENVVSFGMNEKGDIYATNINEYDIGKYCFDVIIYGYCIGNIKLNIFGKHNVYNALVSVFVGIMCGIDFETIKSSIENYMGVERRCEIVGNINGGIVIHDYAHHPKQIEKMIAVAREIAYKKSGKVITVFEPHTYSRTKYLFSDFSLCFEGSDHIILAPVYSARENEREGNNSIQLMEEVKKHIKNTEYILNYDDIYKRLLNITENNDIVLILGAGSIEKLAKIIKNNKN